VKGCGCSACPHRVLMDFCADESFKGAALKAREHYGIEGAEGAAMEWASWADDVAGAGRSAPGAG
jgi:hypothetical protein